MSLLLIVGQKWHAGRVACCPVVSHVEHAPSALLRLEKYGTDGQTSVRYITLTVRPSQRNNVFDIAIRMRNRLRIAMQLVRVRWVVSWLTVRWPPRRTSAAVTSFFARWQASVCYEISDHASRFIVFVHATHFGRRGRRWRVVTLDVRRVDAPSTSAAHHFRPARPGPARNPPPSVGNSASVDRRTALAIM